MEIKHKNITINVAAINHDEYESEMGLGTLYMKVVDLADLYKRIVGNTIGQSWESHETLELEYVGDVIDFVETIVNDYYDEDDEMPISKYIDAKIKENDDHIAIYNSDLIIVFFHHILKYANGHHKTFEFRYEGHPFWILHDIKHSKKDVTGLTIYVDHNIEEERLNEAFEWLSNLGLRHLYNESMHDKIVESFKTRFNRYPILPELSNYIDTLNYE